LKTIIIIIIARLLIELEQLCKLGVELKKMRIVYLRIIVIIYTY